MEKLGLKLVPIWNVSTTGRGLISKATALAHSSSFKMESHNRAHPSEHLNTRGLAQAHRMLMIFQGFTMYQALIPNVA